MKIFAPLFALAFFGCAPGLGDHCSDKDECNAGLTCAAGICVVSGAADEGTSPADIGSDLPNSSVDMLLTTDGPTLADLHEIKDMLIVELPESGGPLPPPKDLGMIDGPMTTDGMSPPKDMGPMADQLAMSDIPVLPADAHPDAAPDLPEIPIPDSGPIDAFIPQPDGPNCLAGCIEHCGEVEVCDGQDNDCDEEIDEDLLNACEECGPTPEEICDGIDNNCDGRLNEGLNCVCANGTTQACYSGTPGTQGRGLCQVGTQTCMNATWASCVGEITPQVETCDGLDNDCNGEVDDNIPQVDQPCAVAGALGVCRLGNFVCNQPEIVCQSSLLSSNEICDGLDNDCDGEIDENAGCNPPPPDMAVPPPPDAATPDAALPPIDASAPPPDAEDASVTPDAAVCVPQLETCDGADNNCNEEIDEGVLNACGQCGPVPQEICDGADNNCNGEIDEGFNLGVACGAGVGACFRSGTIVCNGPNGSTCSAQPAAPTAEICDDADNNCDGQTDEGCDCSPGIYEPVATVCGVGACENTGMTSCQEGQIVDSCMDGQPAAADATCDGIDNDCNGQVDEDYVPVATACGVGPCLAAGQRQCQAGQVIDSCQPRPSSPELCDGVDNDCDGPVDEDFPSLGTYCTNGTGVCTRGDYFICAANGNGVTCPAIPGGAGANEGYSGESTEKDDDDCNGVINDITGCVPGSLTSCYYNHNRTGEIFQGSPCHAGTATCRANGSGWGPCQNMVIPAPDIVGDGIDNNCNGQIDR